MDDTTKWIMVALLLLLIGAAIFMLLRRPGDGRDAALDGDRHDDRLATGAPDRDHDGVPDAREGDLRDASADEDQGRWREAAAIGAMGAAGASAPMVGEDRVDDRHADDVRPLSTDEVDEGARHEPLPMDEQTPLDPDEVSGAEAARERTDVDEHHDDAAFVETPADQEVYTEDDQGRWRDAAAIGAAGAAGMGAGATAVAADRTDDDRDRDDVVTPQEGAPASDGYTAAPASEGYTAAPASDGYTAAPASPEAYVDEPRRDDTYRDDSYREDGYRDEPLTADEVLADEERRRDYPETRGYQESQGFEPTREQEYPVGDVDTTYRADQGEAVVVDQGQDTRYDDRGDEAGRAYADQDGTSVEDRGSYTEDRGAYDDQQPTTSGLGYPEGQTAQEQAEVSGHPVADDGYAATDDSYADQGRTGEPVFAESVFGAGSAEPLEDGSGPSGWEVKGNSGSMLFHTPDSPSYDAVRTEVWFESEEAARAAGFAHWDRRRR